MAKMISEQTEPNASPGTAAAHVSIVARSPDTVQIVGSAAENVLYGLYGLLLINLSRMHSSCTDACVCFRITQD